MKVRTLGKKENPAIVMIPGMFCTSDMPEIVAKYLADDFYMILPTLDGHHGEEPVYHSKQDDAGEIYLFDGGPFFYFPKFIRSFMAGKFMEIGDLARGKSKEEAVSSIMNHKFAKKLKESSPDFYCGILDSFTEIFQWIDRDSVRRIADTCYKCDLPAFDEEQIRRFTFLYSKNEPARKAEIRLRRKYPNAEYLIMKSRGHGGFQAERPEEYAELMRNEAGCGKG